MHRLLLTTTILVVSGTAALADVKLSGEAWMGIVKDYNSSDYSFDSSASVTFTMAGETDNGLSFGATFDSDEAVDAAAGQAGYVYISGSYGKLSMGDVDGAALAAVGQVSSVGVTGLGYLNEIVFFANGGEDVFENGSDNNDPSALYEYKTGDVTFFVSATNPGVDTADSQAIGVLYETSNYAISGGYEKARAADIPGTLVDDESFDIDSYKIALEGIYGKFYGKIIYGHFDGVIGPDAVSGDQLALSVDYTVDALTVTGFYSDDSDFVDEDFGTVGVGATYDLGGGAQVMGGVARNETDGYAYDVGVYMSF